MCVVIVQHKFTFVLARLSNNTFGVAIYNNLCSGVLQNHVVALNKMVNNRAGGVTFGSDDHQSMQNTRSNLVAGNTMAGKNVTL